MKKNILLPIIATTLIFSFSPISSASKVYVHRNADGVLVFSDTPDNKDSKEITTLSNPIVTKPEDTSIMNQGSSKTAAKVSYELNVSQPADKATVRNNSGIVNVSGSITPRFPASHKVRLLLDGQPQGNSMSTPRQTLNNVNRGEHTLQFQLLDQTGKVIASSPTSTFFMHRNTVKKGG